MFFGPAPFRRLPLEPIIKIILPAIGILGELWLGHEQYMCVCSVGVAVATDAHASAMVLDCCACTPSIADCLLLHPPHRNLYASDGKFVVDHINDWQHSSMYSAFILSGAIDLATRSGRLPAGLDTAGLGLCFLTEGLLLVFHLKGPSIEVIVHLILVIQVKQELSKCSCCWAEPFS